MPRATSHPTTPQTRVGAPNKTVTPDPLAEGGAALVAGTRRPSPVRRERRLSYLQLPGIEPTGPDADLLRRCERVLTAYDQFLCGGTMFEGISQLGVIEGACLSVSKVRARTAEGIRAKAEVIRELLTPGAAMYGAGQVAISLANDLLGRA